MAHRATVYKIRAHTRYKPNDTKPFGSIDDGGTYLGEFLRDLFSNQFAASSQDGYRDVLCSNATLNEPDLRVLLQPGERGIRADIMEANGQLGFQQKPDHTQLMRCGSLFRLPRNQTEGWWVLHVNHDRSVKSLVQTELMKRFKDRFPDLTLQINPCVKGEAFKQALDEDRLLSVNLYRHSRSTDIKDGGKWGRTDSGLKLQLGIKAQRGKTLLPTLAKRALQGDSKALGEIVEFAGFPYDEAKFEVELENGLRRSFNIHQLEAGHAMSEDIDLKIGDDGYPTDASIFSELERVLAEME